MVLRPTSAIGSSIRSSPPKRTAWVWDCPSRARSWTCMAAGSGPKTIQMLARRSVSRCRWMRPVRTQRRRPYRTLRGNPVIHIVDDDGSVRTAVARLLNTIGFDTRSYASAAEFLVTDRDDTPSCIVLDVGLPGMSGVELQAAIAKMERALPIVFLTGRGDIDMGVRAMKAGAVDFLTKPVKRDALLAAVSAALARDLQQRARGDEVRALRARSERLTAREREVFTHVVRG